MLDFIGCGSAFNTKLGNNSAYIKKGETLFLIDCGSSTFKRIQELNLLDGVKHINVFITHTHPDHIGSLGDLIFYSYYSMGEMGKPKVHVFAHKYLEMDRILRDVGVTEDKYYLRGFWTDDDHTGFMTIVTNAGSQDFQIIAYAYEVEHADELLCVGFHILYEGVKIYYSGDSNMIPDHVLHSFINGDIDIMYQDTCKADYDGNVHLSLRKLTEYIPRELRHKVYCMHLDKQFDVEEAKSLGFNVVEPTPDIYHTEPCGDVK